LLTRSHRDALPDPCYPAEAEGSCQRHDHWRVCSGRRSQTIRGAVQIDRDLRIWNLGSSQSRSQLEDCSNRPSRRATMIVNGINVIASRF
jgi:hypothetical protein